MSGVPSAKAWEGTWAPWISNQEAASIWLADANNYDFTPWISGVGDQAKHWRALELQISEVSGLSTTRCAKLSKKAVNTILEGSERNRQAHVDLATKKRIGQEFARILKDESRVDWKDDIFRWISAACVSLAPRSIHLAKKAQRNVGKTGGKEGDDNGPRDVPIRTTPASTHSTSLLQSSSKRQKKDHGKAGVAKRNDVEPELPIKPRKTPRSALGSSSFTQIVPARKPLLLLDRSIVVLIDGAARATSWCRISVSAITVPITRGQDTTDIRSEDFEFDRFKLALKDFDTSVDLDSGNGELFYTVSGGARHASRGNVRQIKSNEDFKRAIGELEWESNEAQSTKPFLMNVVGVRKN